MNVNATTIRMMAMPGSGKYHQAGKPAAPYKPSVCDLPLYIPSSAGEQASQSSRRASG